MAQVTVKLNRLRQSPRKVRLVADVIRRKPVAWAQQQLTFLPQRPARNLLKLVKSGLAAAAAKNLSREKLIIKELRVDEGPKLKRFLPAPRGRTYRITKRMSHITLTLAETLAESGNSKHEARNPKQIQNANVQKSKTT